MYVIRKRIKISSEQAMFIFINGTIPSTNAEIYKIYESFKDEDGFLYVTYSGTFGFLPTYNLFFLRMFFCSSDY